MEHNSLPRVRTPVVEISEISGVPKSRWLTLLQFAACASAASWNSRGLAEDSTWAAQDPWSVTVFGGPATNKYFGAVLQQLNFHPTSMIVGAAIDRRLFYLGSDIWLSAEVQGEVYWFGHHDQGYGVGLGILFNEPFGLTRTAFSFYDGPSWDTDPPYTAVGYHGKVYPASRTRFLNYIDAEYAVGLPQSEKWDAVFRLYHRSGMFGVYSMDDDEGMAVGLGLRYRF